MAVIHQSEHLDVRVPTFQQLAVHVSGTKEDGQAAFTCEARWKCVLKTDLFNFLDPKNGTPSTVYGEASGATAATEGEPAGTEAASAAPGQRSPLRGRRARLAAVQSHPVRPLSIRVQLVEEVGTV